MTAVQVLWVNLISDGPPTLALGLDQPAAPSWRAWSPNGPRRSPERGGLLTVMLC
jgi:hypothetical protein